MEGVSSAVKALRLKTVRPTSAARIEARGKFLYVDGRKFYVRGVTYGPFRPDEDGCEYHTPQQVTRDFAQMAQAGINTVRVYTVPPRWLLDIAMQQGLFVMVGLPWEQHITFLDTQQQRVAVEQRVRGGAGLCAGHPAVLCFAVGNEIPPSIVRWYGRRRIQQFLSRLCQLVKQEDPQALATYVNFPTTEYLDVPELDLVSFNVYLETEKQFSSYLARLQNLAGNRPLLMAEIGLDSYRNGERQQADVLDWQLRAAFAEGCCGSFVFSWTDEWHRGGFDIEDWGFGLTDRQHRPKPALEAVSDCYAEAPFPEELHWPRISVVVCTYNGEATIERTCRELNRLKYPDYEVIIVNDGSTDRTFDILQRFDHRVIDLPNGGLSRARNVGAQAATGEIVAYIDDDAYPDPHWLHYLAWAFMRFDFVGVGGPNLLPPDDGWQAECVSFAPGGPTHVLLSDRVAEHIPGCNMAFQKEALASIGGFDERFRVAGDDVDMCWRLQERGGTLGFHAAAVVWHHRRDSLGRYLRQQHNYGWAEALLEEKWPHKYNGFGHVDWSGRIYGDGLTQPLFLRERIYHGVWGSAAFQSIYRQPLGLVQSLPLMPEWFLLILAMLLLTALGAVWAPFLLVLPLLVGAALVTIGQAWLSALRAPLREDPVHSQLKRRGMIALMHLLQPAVRLKGRLHCGLEMWRLRDVLSRLALPRPLQHTSWQEKWMAPEQRLTSLECVIRRLGARVARGDDFAQWDLTIRGGLFGGVRVLMAIEEHGGGKQLVRLRSWPWLHRGALFGFGLFVPLAGLLGVFHSHGAGILLAVLAVLLGVRLLGDCASAMHCYLEALGPVGEGEPLFQEAEQDGENGLEASGTFGQLQRDSEV